MSNYFELRGLQGLRKDECIKRKKNTFSEESPVPKVRVLSIFCVNSMYQEASTQTEAPKDASTQTESPPVSRPGSPQSPSDPESPPVSRPGSP